MSKYMTSSTRESSVNFWDFVNDKVKCEWNVDVSHHFVGFYSLLDWLFLQL